LSDGQRSGGRGQHSDAVLRNGWQGANERGAGLCVVLEKLGEIRVKNWKGAQEGGSDRR